MGAAQSSQLAALQHNCLVQLGGPVALQYNAEFGNDLLSPAAVPLASVPPEEVYEALRPVTQRILVHNPLTHNFQKLVLRLVALSADALHNIQQQPLPGAALRPRPPTPTPVSLPAAQSPPQGSGGGPAGQQGSLSPAEAQQQRLRRLSSGLHLAAVVLQQAAQRGMASSFASLFALSRGLDEPPGGEDVGPASGGSSSGSIAPWPSPPPFRPGAAAADGTTASSTLPFEDASGSSSSSAATPGPLLCALAAQAQALLCGLDPSDRDQHGVMLEALRLMLAGLSTQLHHDPLESPPSAANPFLNALLMAPPPPSPQQQQPRSGGRSRGQPLPPSLLLQQQTVTPSIVVSRLLHLIVTRPPLPPGDTVYVTKGSSVSGPAPSSLSSAMSYLFWGSGLTGGSSSSSSSSSSRGGSAPPAASVSQQQAGGSSAAAASPLGDLAQLLLPLLVLQRHAPPQLVNPFKAALAAATDLPGGGAPLGPGAAAGSPWRSGGGGGTSSSGRTSRSTPDFTAATKTEGQHQHNALPHVSFDALFAHVCGRLQQQEHAALLLYCLLHGCPAFRQYVTCEAAAPEQLLIPLLQTLDASTATAAAAAKSSSAAAASTAAAASPSSPQRLYLLQTLLLMLTEERSFNEHVDSVVLRSVPWFRDQILQDVALSSLTVIVLCRSVTAALPKLSSAVAGDGSGGGGGGGGGLMLPTNALAALSNLAPYTTRLHAAAAWRLLTLVRALGRRYRKLRSLGAASHAEAAAAGGIGGIGGGGWQYGSSVGEDALRRLSISSAGPSSPKATGAGPAPYSPWGDRRISDALPPAAGGGTPGAAPASPFLNMAPQVPLLPPPADMLSIAVLPSESAEAEAALLQDFLRVVLSAVHTLLLAAPTTGGGRVAGGGGGAATALRLVSNQELLHTLLIRHGEGLLDELAACQPGPGADVLLANLAALADHFAAGLDSRAGAGGGGSGPPAATAAAVGGGGGGGGGVPSSPLLYSSQRRSLGGGALPTAPPSPLLPLTAQQAAVSARGGSGARRATGGAPSAGDHAGGSWDVETVRRLVARLAAETWSPAGLLAIPELRFTYEEDSQPELFLVPYSWAHAVALSPLAWPRHGNGGGDGTPDLPLLQPLQSIGDSSTMPGPPSAEPSAVGPPASTASSSVFPPPAAYMDPTAAAAAAGLPPNLRTTPADGAAAGTPPLLLRPPPRKPPLTSSVPVLPASAPSSPFLAAAQMAAAVDRLSPGGLSPTSSSYSSTTQSPTASAGSSAFRVNTSISTWKPSGWSRANRGSAAADDHAKGGNGVTTNSSSRSSSIAASRKRSDIEV